MPDRAIVSEAPKNGMGVTIKHNMMTICISNLSEKKAPEKFEESDGVPARLVYCFSSALDLSCLRTRCSDRPI